MEISRALVIVGIIISFFSLLVFPIIYINMHNLHRGIRLYEIPYYSKYITKKLMEYRIPDQHNISGNPRIIIGYIALAVYTTLALMAFTNRWIALGASTSGLVASSVFFTWYGDFLLPPILSDYAMNYGFVEPGIGLYGYLIGVLIVLAGALIGYKNILYIQLKISYKRQGYK